MSFNAQTGSSAFGDDRGFVGGPSFDGSAANVGFPSNAANANVNYPFQMTGNFIEENSARTLTNASSSDPATFDAAFSYASQAAHPSIGAHACQTPSGATNPIKNDFRQ